ncbi:SafA/ExsA family spore coat assembly protein [Saccharococcus caldoxylosilyticus]|uniref:SafA/ExsA family spore coat assembly protein n=1 Tax=Saccharococcus caldoxylosilyticus TaxID=81408 RepID=UPI003D35357A
MKIHIVQKGDTLWKIAQKYGVDFEQLKKINGHLSNPDMIMPGMKIKVPTAGVPVKKEAPKKEAKINLAPKKEENIEHPYANAKPFVSVNIEAELSEPIKKEKVNKAPKAGVKEAPNVSINEAPNVPINEAPNVPINEAPNVPINEAPNVPIKEAPNVPIKEAPKAPIKEAPKAPIKEAPKAPIKEAPKAPTKEAPKAPINETPNVPINEAPKAPVNEAPKSMENKPSGTSNDALGSEEKQINIPPLSHTIPPVTPNVNINFSNVIPNVPPIPPKPKNILPGIMEQELESPAEAETEKEKAFQDDDNPPPELPKVPYVPIMQQPYLPGAFPTAPISQQHCVPVTPMFPGAGYYFPSMPAVPVPYPSYTQPFTSGGMESSSHAFPGIEESSSESDEAPPMPGYHGEEEVENPTAFHIPSAGYSPSSTYAPASYPGSYAPLPMVQGYGWYPPVYPSFSPVAHHYYAPAPAAFYPYPPQPYMSGAAYPFAPTAAAFPRAEGRVFTEPQDEESNGYDEP